MKTAVSMETSPRVSVTAFKRSFQKTASQPARSATPGRSRPLYFLDFPLPNGAQYEAWENYDFFINPEGSVEEPHQMSWQRYGALPAWAGGEQAIYHLLSHRVESQDEFPAELLTLGAGKQAGMADAANEPGRDRSHSGR